jgi:hypothetical protein
MYPWGSALGIFVLGAGVGALTTAALHVGQIRKLKELLKAAHNKPKPKDKVLNRTDASPPRRRSPSERKL